MRPLQLRYVPTALSLGSAEALGAFSPNAVSSVEPYCWKMCRNTAAVPDFLLVHADPDANGCNCNLRAVTG